MSWLQTRFRLTVAQVRVKHMIKAYSTMWAKACHHSFIRKLSIYSIFKYQGLFGKKDTVCAWRKRVCDFLIPCGFFLSIPWLHEIEYTFCFVQISSSLNFGLFETWSYQNIQALSYSTLPSFLDSRHEEKSNSTDCPQFLRVIRNSLICRQYGGPQSWWLCPYFSITGQFQFPFPILKHFQGLQQ